MLGRGRLVVPIGLAEPGTVVRDQRRERGNLRHDAAPHVERVRGPRLEDHNGLAGPTRVEPDCLDADAMAVEVDEPGAAGGGGILRSCAHHQPDGRDADADADEQAAPRHKRKNTAGAA